ncbi:MAG: ferrous iron transport protein A [Chlorobiota bacterium]|jgi:Fe2+ transport system protein FeoA|nr:MAG: ferrous iron transport protein A [Chlorobiota bacterium]
MLSLEALPPGTPAQIAAVAGPPTFVERMKELGLVEGTVITVLRRSLFGGTLQIRCGNGTLAVRLPFATAICVEPVTQSRRLRESIWQAV